MRLVRCDLVLLVQLMILPHHLSNSTLLYFSLSFTLIHTLSLYRCWREEGPAAAPGRGRCQERSAVAARRSEEGPAAAGGSKEGSAAAAGGSKEGPAGTAGAVWEECGWACRLRFRG